MHYDVVIVGGGPGGLAAALTLGRGRKRVLLCDAGEPRNARAVHMHNFVTRDGTPPREMRRLAREELAKYPTVEVRDTRVDAIRGEKDAFDVSLGGTSVKARRILLAVGMVDELPDMPGVRELWGRTVFQCPYCHGYELADRRFGCWANDPAMMEWALLLEAWSNDVVVFTNGAFAVPEETRVKLARARIGIEERPIRALRGEGDALGAVELEGGASVPRDALIMRPPQRQTAIVASLGLEYDAQGFVRLDDHRMTSRPGIYGAGDCATPMQAAIAAAQSGMFAAAMLNHELTAYDALHATPPA